MPKQISQQVYAAISFDQGGQPDLEKLRTLFIEDGLLVNNKGAKPVIKPVIDYISFVESNIAAGAIQSIQETELCAHVEVFGKVAQIRSAYCLVYASEETEMKRYGVNLFQLIQRDTKWLITAMCWDDATDKTLLIPF